MQDRLDALREALAPYPWAYSLIVLSALLLVAWLANLITRRVLLRGLRHVIARVAALTGHTCDSISRMRVILSTNISILLKSLQSIAAI